ncbi:hypothetical protein BZG04_15775, partial [Salinivibrio kushneri]|uniref:surface carbohydrate biosynthesis protein n=1 Tax=Salinivibrio kushneri TaxID=1908198 RepID=UPI0009C96651
IIPIELFQREIYTRLYLAIILVNKGYDVLICDQLNPKIFNFRKAVVFYKDHAHWSLNYYKKLKKNGMKIVAHDAEGLIIDNPNFYRSGRVSADVIELIDGILCWGDKQKEIINSVRSCQKIHIAGDLRFDVARQFSAHCSPSPDNKYLGKHVLINTRFSYTNPLSNNDIKASFIRLGYLKDKEDIERFTEIVNNDYLIQEEFYRLIRILSNNDFKVTIRPHPAENEIKYKELFGDSVVIDKHRSINSQIAEADFVVHDGCTTAIEARAQGKIVLGLRPPLVGCSYDNYANQFSTENFDDAKALARFINSYKIEMNPLQSTRYPNKEFRKDIANFGEGTKFFTDVFLEVISNFDLNGYHTNSFPNRYDFKDFVKKFLFRSRCFLPEKYARKSRFFSEFKLYQGKYPEIDVSLLEGYCNEISRYTGINIDELVINKLNSKAFMLKKGK